MEKKFTENTGVVINFLGIKEKWKILEESGDC